MWTVSDRRRPVLNIVGDDIPCHGTERRVVETDTVSVATLYPIPGYDSRHRIDNGDTQVAATRHDIARYDSATEIIRGDQAGRSPVPSANAVSLPITVLPSTLGRSKKPPLEAVK